jgi:sigma-E factor negative regulatory protein RseC
MHEEVGTVIESRGGTARVLVKRNSACDHCPSRSCCASLEGDVKGVNVSNVIGAREGQKVKIGISPKAVLKASFILYMVPILALIIGAVLGNYLGPQHREIWTVSLGVGFFVGSYLVIKALSKLFENKAEYVPVVTEILADQTSGYDKIH